MDVYGLSSPDLLRIDDLLDFSNEDIFSASSSGGSTAATSSSSFPPPQNPNFHHHHHLLPSSTDHHSFLHDICVPSDDAAHLEWLSQFVDDSFADFPANPLGGTMTSVKTETTSFPGKPRSKRSRAPAAFAGTWTPMPESEQQIHSAGKFKPKKEQSSGGGGRHQSSSTETAEGGGMRRCTHCASEKTPQWRTGPLGPKTLCNACGVRFKSGRLVPEYRPASSPTFVLTQHSNSHRKVMELRRQKEVMRQPPQVQLHHHHHHPPF
ncbi:GATA transcription factor 2 [Cardamine amara subsp. amara]|uniref:GATA transcription factor n=1 Tax=Cardamine amara subsp. amara TaxID=228776 RepID=A0ABD0ZT59_CARAN